MLKKIFYRLIPCATMTAVGVVKIAENRGLHHFYYEILGFLIIYASHEWWHYRSNKEKAIKNEMY